MGFAGANAIGRLILGRSGQARHPDDPGRVAGRFQEFDQVVAGDRGGHGVGERVAVDGGVLHQAGNYGKAVALPRLGDLAELIAEEGYTGAFFEPNSPQSLADALAEVLDNSERRQEMGMRNYLAACGLPMAEVVDWYLLHAQTLLAKPPADRQQRLAASRR